MMPVEIKRSVYADMFGPTTGDRVRRTPSSKINGFSSAAVRSLVASYCTLFFVSAAAADETRWRLAKPNGDELMLVMTGTDDATDAIGSPYFRCKPKTGLVTVENDMQNIGVRHAIAGLILNDGYPTVELLPGSERSSIDEISSADEGGWGYRFQIDNDTAAFNMFRKTGYFQFKIGNAVVHAGVKAGLDKIAEFQAACRRPPTPGSSDRSKAQK